MYTRLRLIVRQPLIGGKGLYTIKQRHNRDKGSKVIKTVVNHSNIWGTLSLQVAPYNCAAGRSGGGGGILRERLRNAKSCERFVEMKGAAEKK